MAVAHRLEDGNVAPDADVDAPVARVVEDRARIHALPPEFDLKLTELIGGRDLPSQQIPVVYALVTPVLLEGARAHGESPERPDGAGQGAKPILPAVQIQIQIRPGCEQ